PELSLEAVPLGGKPVGPLSPLSTPVIHGTPEWLAGCHRLHVLLTRLGTGPSRLSSCTAGAASAVASQQGTFQADARPDQGGRGRRAPVRQLRREFDGGLGGTGGVTAVADGRASGRFRRGRRDNRGRRFRPFAGRSNARHLARRRA